MCSAVQLYIPEGVVENGQGEPLMWFHNEKQETVEAKGFYSGHFIIIKLTTEYEDRERTSYRLYQQVDELDIYTGTGMYRKLESAMQAAELLENG